MTFAGLGLRNLRYHWRGNLAVFLGIALGAAILTGALLVGDSLRGSLKALTLDQLGWVEDAMLPGRFFRADLAKEIAAEAALAPAGETKATMGVRLFSMASMIWRIAVSNPPGVSRRTIRTGAPRASAR